MHYRRVSEEPRSWCSELDRRGPFRWPLLDGRLAYFDRAGESEWIAPRLHEERSPSIGVEWWWSTTLDEMVQQHYAFGDTAETISTRLNVPVEAVEHLLGNVTPTEEARRRMARAPQLARAASSGVPAEDPPPRRERGARDDAERHLTRLARLHRELTRQLIEDWRQARLECQIALLSTIEDEPGHART